jgi:hypothetical protein
MTKTKWFIYTVVIGLIPFAIRLLIFLVRKDVPGSYVLNEVDMIAFGLVLNVSNITELDGNSMVDDRWKTTNIGLSVVLVILFGAFLTVSYLSALPGPSLFDKPSIKKLSLMTAAGSLWFSYSIFKRFV